jgi:hypothetical protein
VAVVLAFAMAAPLRAEGPPPGRTPARVGAAPGSSGMTSVIGYAWKADNSPIPEAHVQLRNLVSGKVEARTVADEAGQFTFTRLEGGTYVVELVGTNDADYTTTTYNKDNNNKILTVGHAFVIAPGETVATFVRLGTKAPWLYAFFSNTASAVASTAAGLGITAIAPVQLPLTNNR